MITLHTLTSPKVTVLESFKLHLYGKRQTSNSSGVRDKRIWDNLIVLVNKLTIRGISLIIPSIYLQEQSDVHLRDYDPEIFDDDDFYHQVMTSDGVFSLRKGNANLRCAKTQDY